MARTRKQKHGTIIGLAVQYHGSEDQIPRQAATSVAHHAYLAVQEKERRKRPRAGRRPK